VIGAAPYVLARTMSRTRARRGGAETMQRADGSIFH
jgi:hypothetical protein